LHGDVLMWLMKTLLTSGCTNQRGAGHHQQLMPKSPEACEPHIEHYRSISSLSPGEDVKVLY
ncbi:hypothetical protein FKK20_24515, partial [Enterobacter hormaechei]|nr:hypothetical protein [Enterobacter hormaechei]